MFPLSGYISSKDSRMWRTETPYTQLGIPLHWPRITQFIDYELRDHFYLERELLLTIIKTF